MDVESWMSAWTWKFNQVELSTSASVDGRKRWTARKKRKLGDKRYEGVAAGAHLPTPWLFEPAKRPDDRGSETLLDGAA